MRTIAGFKIQFSEHLNDWDYTEKRIEQWLSGFLNHDFLPVFSILNPKVFQIGDIIIMTRRTYASLELQSYKQEMGYKS